MTAAIEAVILFFPVRRLLIFCQANLIGCDRVRAGFKLQFIPAVRLS
jgi:hypothetical protein